jgi:hypothetical protein
MPFPHPNAARLPLLSLRRTDIDTDIRAVSKPRLSPTGAPVLFHCNFKSPQDAKPTAQYRIAVMAVCASAAQVFNRIEDPEFLRRSS